MKILITTQYFYPENFRINDFAFKMVKRGHDVFVITGLPNYPEGKFFGDYKILSGENINGVMVYRVPLISRKKSRGFELAINYLSFVLSALTFGPFLLRKIQPDIIFSVNYSPATVGIVGVLFSKLKKAPLFVWVQDLWPDSLLATGAIRSRFILRGINKMVKWIYRNSNLIFIQSRSFSDSLVTKGGLEMSKIRYLPNWAEDNFNSSSKDNEQPYLKLLPENKFIIMFAGNLGVAQSLETIIRAAEKIKDYPIHWVFLGDGRQKEWLENVVSNAGLQNNVSILGRYPLEDMPKFFELADAMLVTLKKDPAFKMTIPGKIQSYLRSAKPILSAIDGAGAAIIQESGAGFNVNSEDFLGLAEAARKMSKLSSEDLDKMSSNAKNYYNKNFDVEVLLSQFELEIECECSKIKPV
jgi:glycosyltransferase involved in cell wall biosynthesis